MVQAYDIETDNLFEFPLCKSFFSLKGVSQIFMENKLFLCGCTIENIKPIEQSIQDSFLRDDLELDISPNIFSSSFMYSINLLNNPIELCFEVNSCFLHYYPALSVLRNQYIIVIGGYKSKKCEYYSNSNKKWKELPDLPEERYGCTSICDNTYNSIYCFGGYNAQSGLNCETIFKLNVSSGIKWDTIIVIEDAYLLARHFSCIVKKDDGHCLILGGKNNKGDSTDEIVDLDLKKGKITIGKEKTPSLGNYLIFSSLRVGMENSNGNSYIFEDEEDDIVLQIGAEYCNPIKLYKE